MQRDWHRKWETLSNLTAQRLLRSDSCGRNCIQSIFFEAPEGMPRKRLTKKCNGKFTNNEQACSSSAPSRS
eukprot:2237115-Prorocentrum_lima.AAC.1